MSYLPPARLIPTITKRLKFIQLTSAGVNHLATHPIFTSTSIPITTTSGIHGPPISEWVALQILSDNHLQRTMYKWQSERRWVRAAGDSTAGLRDGVGRRVGILGYGSIGRQCKIPLCQIIRLARLTSYSCTRPIRNGHGHYRVHC